jgi:hypothetical protein
MRREIIIRFAILASVALTAFLILRSSSLNVQPAPGKTNEPCCQQKCSPPENNMIWENFSRQFISIEASPVSFLR